MLFQDEFYLKVLQPGWIIRDDSDTPRIPRYWMQATLPRSRGKHRSNAPAHKSLKKAPEYVPGWVYAAAKG
jgi:hypothetical protein